MDRDELRRQLADRLKTPGERASFAWAATLASIAFPPLGNMVSAVASIRDARSQRDAEEVLLQWMDHTAETLTAIERVLEVMNANPDKTSLVALLTDILGAEAAARLTERRTRETWVVLNPATVEELQGYARQGMIQIEPTHVLMALGANNQVEGHCEDSKRPYGNGYGFRLRLSDAFGE